jgi:hypothetical protein
MCPPDVKGVVGSGDKKEELGEELIASDSRMYSAIVARGVYLAHGRSDIAFAFKGLSMWVSALDGRDWQLLKRSGRCMIKRERAVSHYMSIRGVPTRGQCGWIQTGQGVKGQERQ